MMNEDFDTRGLRRRLAVAAVMMLVVFGAGTFGFFMLGAGRWRISDCAYMTIITITTVGYSEVLAGLHEVAYARLFTAALVVMGTGIALYSVSVLTTFLVEGEFFHIRRRRRMRRRIAKMDEHIVVCGTGRTGTHIVAELCAAHRGFVVIDTDVESIERCAEDCLGDVDYLVGDATDDSVLIDAGIDRAYGVIAALPEDKDNLYVVVTARGLNPSLRIVAKAVDPRAVTKLQAAGANRVVSVNRIGGERMASEMIRPEVVNFVDTMLRDSDQNLRFEEVTIPHGSALAGKVLAESDIRKERKLLVVAARDPERALYTYSPGPDFPLREGMTLIIIGETASVQRLRESRLLASVS